MIEQVITGGQTGVDQAGWRAAKAAGIATGGFMPMGFRTEQGNRPAFAELYGARDLESLEYRVRTGANVREADAVVWLGDQASRGGRLTLGLARIMAVPTIIVEQGEEGRPTVEPDRLAGWVRDEDIRTLMVAGNRESTSPGIGAWAEQYLAEVFQLLATGG